MHLKFMKKKILILSFLISKAIIACECPELKSVSKDLTVNYDVIFFGKVDSIAPCSTQGKSFVYFTINELYKGTTLPHVKIDFDCSSACLMSFAKDEQWLMYITYKKFDLLTVNLCSHSRKYFNDATQDFYQIAAQRTFEEEKQFLKATLGIQSFTQKNDLAEQEAQRQRNEQPSGMNKLLLLFISFAAMAIVYFVTRNKNKK
jgi:hypothetical protein